MSGNVETMNHHRRCASCANSFAPDRGVTGLCSRCGETWDEPQITDPPISEVIDTATAAEIAGVSRPAFAKYHSDGLVPRPVAFFGKSPVWHRASIERWRDTRHGSGRRSTRVPTKKQAGKVASDAKRDSMNVAEGNAQ